MKTNCWLILGLLVATGAFAQTSTNVPSPMTPPPDASVSIAPPPLDVKTNPPAKKKSSPAKKKILSAAAPKKSEFTEPSVMLMPGTAEVAVSNLNVRGQAGLKGEVVGHLNKGEAVTVVNQINLDKHAAGEPAQWAKIALPASTKIWLNTKFIDATNKTVVPKKLNLRAGPGENYSVLGVLEHGTAINVINTKGDWAQIETPTNAYAFVAAMYLKQTASGTTVATTVPTSTETEPMPAPTPTPVVETPPVITTPPPVVPTPEIPAPIPLTAPAIVDTNPPPPRVVTHEGVVGHVGSIIAPTAYVLYDPATRQDINFLYTTSTNLDIGRYLNMRIIVTGEEGIATRWNDTPVLTIQRIVVIDTNAVPKVNLPTPRQRR